MNAWYLTCHALFSFIGREVFSFKVLHPERIPKEGGVILASNHQSFLDPPLLGISSSREIHTLARKSLFDWPILGKLFPRINVVPIDLKKGDMGALKTIIRLANEGNATAIFPEGTRSADGSLKNAQPGLGLIIAKTLAPVVPIRIFGAFEAFPRDRKMPRLHPITVVIGEPIYFTEKDLKEGGKDLYQKLSDRVMARIAELEIE